MWRLDGLGTPYMIEFASCWALLSGSLLIALPMILFKVKDHVPIEDDMAFSDQTYAEVAPTNHVGKGMEDEEGLTLQSVSIRGDNKV